MNTFVNHHIQAKLNCNCKTVSSGKLEIKLLFMSFSYLLQSDVGSGYPVYTWLLPASSLIKLLFMSLSILWDPGIFLTLDPGSGMEKIRIRNKHPGSATLLLFKSLCFLFQLDVVSRFHRYSSTEVSHVGWWLYPCYVTNVLCQTS